MFYGILAALAAVIVGLDQWTKWLTVTHIPSTNGSAVVKAIPGFSTSHTSRTPVRRGRCSRGQTWLFVLVTAVFFVILGVLIWKKVLQKKFELVCLAMIAGGALGNLIDRVVSGAVTDMIRLEFVNFPVFNVADCFVTTGCALLIVYVLFFDRPKKIAARAGRQSRIKASPGPAWVPELFVQDRRRLVGEGHAPPGAKPPIRTGWR